MLESSIHTRSLTWADAESVTGVKEDELKQRLADVTSVNEPAVTNPERPEASPSNHGGCSAAIEAADKVPEEQLAEAIQYVESFLNRIRLRGNSYCVGHLDSLNPTPAQIDDASMWFRHDFGLLSLDKKEMTRFHAKEWLRAWQKVVLR